MNIRTKHRPFIHTKWILLFALFCTTLGLRAQVTISGNISKEGTPVREVPVGLTGSDNQVVLTDNTGNYTFTVDEGGTYQIVPFVEANPLNGVSTYDQVLIQKHLENILPLGSPYKIIAGDTDGDFELTAYDDSLQLRNIILGIDVNFPGNFSWRFVPKSHVFADPTNPFPYPQTLTYTNLTTNITGADFEGIKVGDVNNTAIADGGGTDNVLYQGRVAGIVQWDENANCSPDASEVTLGGWIVKAQKGTQTFYGNTDKDGKYSIQAPTGIFTVELIAPNELWSVCTPIVTDVFVPIVGTTVVDFSAESQDDCPRLTVDISTPFLRRCFSNYYVVDYCNLGTAKADDAYVRVELDSYMDVTSSTIPWSSISGNTYTFPIGDVAVGACGSFKIRFTLDCDATLGQTHCSEAHIFPDSLCAPALTWDGSNLVVTAACESGDVVFTITNTGADMQEVVNFVVQEDIMIQMMAGPIQLEGGASEVITIPANGSTWRLEIEQSTSHPWNLASSASIEGCGTSGTGTVSLGIINQYPLNDEAPFSDLDCMENIGAFDPNDKQGFPLGVGSEKAILRSQSLDYLIRFQNTGTDTAFNIVVLDTLPATLDVSSIRMLSASHDYQFSVLGNGILKWIFPNIMLPDSNVNELGSHGYLKFRIAPVANLPENTQILNRAGIYFDYNLPVLTDYSLHTIKTVLTSVSLEIFKPEVSLSVFPNPTATKTIFEIKSATPLTGRLRIFDLRGTLVLEQAFDHNLFEVPVSQFAPGTYLFQVESQGKPLANGKMMVIAED